MSGRNRDRLYTKRDRFYGDFRDFSDVGGGQEALIADGERYATKDRDEATQLLSDRLQELKDKRAGKEEATAEDPLLEAYARRHLETKAGYRKASTVARDEGALRNVLGYFGRDVRLSEIGVRELTDYVAWRRQQPGNRKGSTISAQTILHELHALSSLYKRAVAEDVAAFNPVRRMPEKPSVQRGERVWLEPGQAARLLAAAAEMDADPDPQAVPFLEALLATFLLTGGRASEVFGLLVQDVDLDRETIRFRPNSYRTLKRPRHDRTIPLWPQLRKALEPHLEQREVQGGNLLFPSPKGGMLTNVRRSLSTALETAEIETHVTMHTFRHTYAAARLQTTDHGAPISPYTVMRELGHSSLALIEKTYGHVMKARHRSPVVEYREGEVIGDVRQRREARGA